MSIQGEKAQDSKTSIGSESSKTRQARGTDPVSHCIPAEMNEDTCSEQYKRRQNTRRGGLMWEGFTDGAHSESLKGNGGKLM